MNTALDGNDLPHTGFTVVLCGILDKGERLQIPSNSGTTQFTVSMVKLFRFMDRFFGIRNLDCEHSFFWDIYCIGVILFIGRR